MVGKSTVTRFRGSAGRAAILVAVLAALSPACSELNSQFDGPKYESQHFVYRTQASDPDVCEEALEHLDAHAEALADLLSLPLNHKGRYYKFSSDDALDDAGVCRESAQSCYGDNTIYTTRPVDGHEVSHWVMGQSFGTDISGLVAEGIATAVSCEPHFEPRTDDWDFRDFGVDPPLSDSFNHAQAGRLMLGLWGLNGSTAVWTKLMGLSADTTNEELDRRATQLGTSLDEAWSYAVEHRLPSCVPVYACSGPALDWGSSELTAGCHGFEPATLPEQEGGLRFYSSDLAVRIMPCSPDADPFALHRLRFREPAGDFEFWFPKSPGKQAVWLEDSETSTHDRSTELRFESLPSAFLTACENSASEVRENQNVALVVVGEPLQFVPLSMEVPGPLELRWDGPIPADVSVSWCGGCDAGEAVECQALTALSMGGRHVLNEVQSGVLRIETHAALPSPVKLELLPSSPR